MIHVVSSGDVTVGEGVMDAYVRAAVAGDDGTLQAGERAVLDAVAAGDEAALTAALAALPDGYDDAWKARMRAFRAARGAKRTDHHGSQGNAPGTNARLAEQAAVEILDIPRAGVRAMALSHTEIADHIRRGGFGGTLSDDERAVLAAVLTGGDLEAALGELPAAYTNAWKDGVRMRAMSYNAGDIRVDVTGGTIVSEGDGVHARYVVTHDRNGAVAVTVAEGAVVTGGRHGVYVGGAGLAAGSDGLRDQTVTVNGDVVGGTGAGVYFAGGGTLIVGENGRVRAGSGAGGAGAGARQAVGEGVAVRADGAGAFRATVDGRVDGDIVARGSGEHTITVTPGGTVRGSVLSESGDLVVVLVDADETSATAVPPLIEGRIEETGGEPRVLIQRSGSPERTELTAGEPPAPSGPWDVSVARDASGRLAVAREFGPRARVYEALPSFLLGLNAPAGFGERSAAVRSANGAWVVVETARGSWKAERSTTPGLKYRHRRHGATTGLDVPVGGGGLLGLSLHHRGGTAEVAGGGEIALSGRGVGLSGSWVRDGAYVDLRAETTWWDADFTSSLRGRLKREAAARGRALGLETGLRIERSGASMTPRVGLTHSRVSMAAFEDATGARVSLEDGRRLGGRAGVAAEATPWALSEARLFGSLDVERELSGNAKVRVSGTRLRSDSPATWLRLGLGGSHEWGEGRYALAGEMRYATSAGGGHDLGAGLNLAVRF